jgi:polysaccharide export outer membrane protein
MKNKQAKFLLRLAVVVLLSAALGCAHGGGPGRSGAQPASGLPAEGSAPDDHYIIGQSDELEVQVWQEPDLSRTGVVRADGIISLPLVNDVKAEGLTVKELRELLTEKYSELVADPVVSVMVIQPRSATFFITGKVAKPGEYTLFKETTLLQAVATAGGFTEWARTGDIAVIRKDGERIRVDYGNIVKGDARQNVILQRGDTVVVP